MLKNPKPRRKTDDAEMSFWDHLEVLRGTLFRSLIAVALVSVFFLAIPRQLFDFVLWPSRGDFPFYTLTGLNFSMELINIEVSAQFFVHLRIAVLSGIVVAFPYIIYELWRFVRPALYENERKAGSRAFGMASFLFYLGAAVGYFIVLPVCLVFFMNYTVSDAVANTITLGSYISLFTSLVFMIGLLFEFPTIVMVLSALGLLHKADLKAVRKYAFVLVLLLAALITPSDPVSMFVLGIPLYGLFEFSILICRK